MIRLMTNNSTIFKVPTNTPLYSSYRLNIILPLFYCMQYLAGVVDPAFLSCTMATLRRVNYSEE